MEREQAVKLSKQQKIKETVAECNEALKDRNYAKARELAKRVNELAPVS